MFANNLHLLAQLDDRVQLDGVGILDELALEVLKLGRVWLRLLLDLLELLLHEESLGSSKAILGGLYDLVLQVGLAASHLTQRVILGSEVLDLLPKLLVLAAKLDFIIADFSDEQVKLQEYVLQMRGSIGLLLRCILYPNE